jgi:hypothetical protein
MTCNSSFLRLATSNNASDQAREEKLMLQRQMASDAELPLVLLLLQAVHCADGNDKDVDWR